MQLAPATIEVFDATPAAAVPTAPLNGATNVSLVPTLSWSPVVQAASYRVEVATDAGFSNVVATATVNGPSHTLAAPLDPTAVYHWRVGADNPCGEGVWSAAFSFTTRAVPPILLVDDDDNSPDVRATYTAGLDAIGLQYDVWDTDNSDVEPSAGRARARIGR